ncbi:KR domain-containing protein, partial [Streptomyces sp. KLOTTS4A1]|uniref:KR domain-containing protein n=1 Tax=Streptomyces sp. KLOTTS4A1 TaxID=3390996 RepID=UPI0039F5B6DA
LMQALPTGGAMVAVQATEDQVLPLLTEEVSIAAVNGPASVVISGDEDAVQEIASRFEKTKKLRVSHAFHSPRMEPMLDEFRALAQQLTFHAPRIPVVSNVTGTLAGDEIRSADYWVRHVREAVRFADGIGHLESQGVTTYLELGPGGVLSAMAQDTTTSTETDAVFVPALRKNRPEPDAVVTALAELHVHGAAVDWTAYHAGTGAQRVDLPTYVFQHQHYWPKAPVAGAHPGAYPGTAEAGQGQGQGSGPDEAFWEAVEREDLVALAEGGLDLSADTPLAEALPALSSWRTRRLQQSAVDNRRYHVTWKPVRATGAALTGRWLLAVPDALSADTADWVTHGLKASGAEVVRIGAADTDLSAYADAAGVVSLLAIGEDTLDDDGLAPGVTETLMLIRRLGEAGIEAPLWCLTQGAVSTGTSDPLRNAAQAQVWGLGRVVALEQPSRWGGLVDLPDTLDARTWELTASVLAATTGEDQTAVRPAGVYASRLAQATAPVGDGAWEPRGTVLISDGTTPAAAQVANWLAGTDAERVVLLAPAGRVPDADVLERLGERATVKAVDVSDRAELAALVAALEAEGSAVRAVLHTPGDTGTGGTAANDTDPSEALRARAAGAANLDAVFADADLDAFVLFSSVAGVWGGGGQASYAAGAAYLDGLAQLRQSRGRVATSVAWGPWADVATGGAAVTDDAQDGVTDDVTDDVTDGVTDGAQDGAQDAVPDGAPDDVDADGQLRRRGLSALDPEHALAALAHAAGGDAAVLTVVDVDWERFAPAFTALRPSPLLADLPQVARIMAAAAEDGSEDADVSAGLRERLAALSEEEQEAQLLELIRQQAASVLGHSSMADVEPDRAFREMGFDSLMAVDLRNRLTRATGLRLAAGFVFDHPNAVAGARLLRQELFRDGTASGDSLLQELDRLEASLVTSEPDALTRTRVAVRLQAFLAKWQGQGRGLGQEPGSESEFGSDSGSGTGTGAGTGAAPEGGVLDQLESASDDELLSFLDRELGR